MSPDNHRHTIAAVVCMLLLNALSPDVLYSTQDAKRELRGVWIATAIQLDWPRTLDKELQQDRLHEYIRRAYDIGLNSIFFQVVARGDAMYRSERLPWSPWLTGTPGGDPGWDPLAYAIECAGMYGMELHAWFNVFLVGNIGNTPKSLYSTPAHIVFTSPEWIDTVDNSEWINPGNPEARQWIHDTVLELVENYDIDGIHFDYIRYSTSGLPSDPELYEQYAESGNTGIDDWRRENINQFVRTVYSSIKERKPWVKIGSAVTGSYQYYPDAPPSNWGYSDVFQESRLWLQEGVHDYVAPMVYRAIGNEPEPGRIYPSPDFVYLSQDWVSNSFDRHVYIGLGVYRDFIREELDIQIDTLRYIGADGQISFRYEHIAADPPFSDRYMNRSLIPVMPWGDTEPTPPVTDFAFSRHSDKPVSVLQWEQPEDIIRRFVIYRFSDNNLPESEMIDAKHIDHITNKLYYNPDFIDDGKFYFAVTALDRNNNESGLSPVVRIYPPEIPILISPADDSIRQRDTLILKWEYTAGAAEYYLELSRQPDFSDDILIQSTGLEDTSYTVTGLDGQQNYYWRVKSRNPAGDSEYSNIFRFETGFPPAQELVSPLHAAVGISGEVVTFLWRSDTTAHAYRFQLSPLRSFPSEYMTHDTTVTDDTSITVFDLDKDRAYYWRVGGINDFGMGVWSSVWGFRTAQPVTAEREETLPAEFRLNQNYPNPFNPETVIVFEIPTTELVHLRLYDLLGREVIEIFRGNLTPGKHRVLFNASDIPSGVYIYTLSAGSFSTSRKMLVIR
jgi:uncharacterized lipoprotein YddW (UPF0748 family)